MAALFPHLATTLPFLPALRPSPRRLPPAASAAPPRGASVVPRRSRHLGPVARNYSWVENGTSFRIESPKKALFASETDSPGTDSSKQSGASDDSSSPDGPPVLTILAGIIVFFLVFWVIGSIFTWIAGLVFGAAKS